MTNKTTEREEKTKRVETSAPRGKHQPGSRLVLLVLMIVIAAGLSVAVWQQVREHVLANNSYLVDPAQIAVTPPPPWIRSEVGDLRAEALMDANFPESLSLLDPELTPRIAAAFTAHPWVARVTRVSKKFPATVEVVIEYRQPVAMVETPDGAYPIDAEGVLLPTADFALAPQAAAAYPRITSIHSAPPVKPGVKWNDEAVVGSAQIAAALLAHWKSLSLARIEPIGRAPAIGGGAEFLFTITTTGGTRIRWGRAPSGSIPGEPSADAMLLQLRNWVAENGSLDDGDQPQQLEFEKGVLSRKQRPPVPALPVTR